MVYVLIVDQYIELQFMKLNKSQTDLKARFEKFGYKVYFKGNKVRVWTGKSWLGDWHRFVDPRSGFIRITSEDLSCMSFREAYKIAKSMTGKGKSLRPWAKWVKHESSRVTRTKIRDQIKSGCEEIGYPTKLAGDPWCYD